MFVAQAFCHSLIASIIMDQALRAWNIEDPRVRQRFRAAVVLFPIFSFPLYQAMNPGRSSLLFRQSALFDVNRWLNVEPWGLVSLGFLFLLLLAITSLIFLLQELLPVLRHSLESKSMEHEGARREPDLFIEDLARSLSIAPPEVFVLEDDDLHVFSTTGGDPAVFVSTGLVSALSPDELRAALAHEVAHIARSRRPLLLAVFFLRMVLFFNPVALVEFRRVVRNEEKICDDIAVSWTRRPEALAGALRKFYAVRETPEPASGPKPLFAPVRLEEHSYNLQLDGRIARLLRNAPRAGGGRWLPFTLAILITACINYFIV
jgi:Zn-dependent protease with chaperone function